MKPKRIDSHAIRIGSGYQAKFKGKWTVVTLIGYDKNNAFVVRPMGKAYEDGSQDFSTRDLFYAATIG